MKKTQILYPLDDTVLQTIVKNLKESWRDISKKLNDLKEGKDITFEKLLDSLSVSEETYILAIRSHLNCPTIFLRRRPNELRVNNYNPACLSAWRANITWMSSLFLMFTPVQCTLFLTS